MRKILPANVPNVTLRPGRSVANRAEADQCLAPPARRDGSRQGGCGGWLGDARPASPSSVLPTLPTPGRHPPSARGQTREGSCVWGHPHVLQAGVLEVFLLKQTHTGALTARSE